MRLIYGPKVYLVGRQEVVKEELQRFLDDHEFSEWTTDSPSDAETLVEVAARSCYQAFKRGRPHKEHLENILASSHGSVTEHAVWSLMVTDVSRSLSLELLRHRAGLSPSQLSQRYVDESVAEYVVPPDLQDEVKAAESLFYRSWVDPEFSEYECRVLLESDYLTDEERAGVNFIRPLVVSHGSYQYLSEYMTNKAMRLGMDGTSGRKFARQSSRAVLPNASETKLFLTVNARAARHICELRASRHADPEIRILAYNIWRVLKVEAPNLFGDYTETTLPDGTTELTTPNRKV